VRFVYPFLPARQAPPLCLCSPPPALSAAAIRIAARGGGEAGRSWDPPPAPGSGEVTYASIIERFWASLGRIWVDLLRFPLLLEGNGNSIRGLKGGGC